MIRHVQPAVHVCDTRIGPDHGRTDREGLLVAGGADDVLGTGNDQPETSGVLNDKVLLFRSANNHHQL